GQLGICARAVETSSSAIARTAREKRGTECIPCDRSGSRGIRPYVFLRKAGPNTNLFCLESVMLAMSAVNFFPVGLEFAGEPRVGLARRVRLLALQLQVTLPAFPVERAGFQSRL